MKYLYYSIMFNNLEDKAQLQIKTIMPSKVTEDIKTTNFSGVTYDMIMRLKNNIFGISEYSIQIPINKLKKQHVEARMDNILFDAATVPKLRSKIKSFIQSECISCFLLDKSA